MKTISSFFAKGIYHGLHGFKRRAACWLLMLLLFLIGAIPSFAQIQQAWVAKYDNGITNGNHQALKMTLDSSGNIYVLGVSANASTNTGYVVVKYAPNGNQIWAARYDSTNFPTASPTGFAFDNGNNVVVTGNALTAKFDANGGLLWAVPYNGAAIATDLAQNVYVTGIDENFTTIKLTPSGSNVWTETVALFQQSNNLSEAIAIDSSTNVYVAGWDTYYGDSFSGSKLGVIKYNPNGDQTWEQTLDNNPDASAVINIVGLMLDPSNDIFIEANIAQPGDRGYQTFEYDTNGDIILNIGAPMLGTPMGFATGLTLDNSNNILTTGGYGYYYTNKCYGTYKLSTNGSTVWGALWPNPPVGNGAANSVVVDKSNSVYVTGFSPSLGTNGTSDIVTIKYDSNGNQLWVQRYNGPENGNDVGNAIAVDNSGNVYVAGYETETNSFTSMILIKYSPVTIQTQSNGNVILHAYGSPGESFDFQASTNLQTWQDLGTILADTNGLAQFDDTNASLFPARFYYTIPK